MESEEVLDEGDGGQYKSCPPQRCLPLMWLFSASRCTNQADLQEEYPGRNRNVPGLFCTLRRAVQPWCDAERPKGNFQQYMMDLALRMSSKGPSSRLHCRVMFDRS